MKRKKRLLSVLMAAVVMLTTATGAFAADLGPSCRSVDFNGEIQPYTMYISSVGNTCRAIGNTVSFTVNISTTRTVSKMWYNVTLQRYSNGSWVNAAPSRYYEKTNCSEFELTDSFGNLPSGTYRIVADNNAQIYGAYTDYVYSESNLCYLF